MLRDLDTQASAIPDEFVHAGKLHVAYEYLYAGSLLMRRSDRAAFSVDVQGPKLGGYIDVGTDAKIETESATTVRFTSTGKPAAFAYKAGSVKRNNGRWEFYPEQMMARGFAEAAESVPYLPQRGTVLHVDDG